MTDDNGINPELAEIMAEHVDWLNQATERAISEGATGLQRAREL